LHQRQIVHRVVWEKKPSIRRSAGSRGAGFRGESAGSVAQADRVSDGDRPRAFLTGRAGADYQYVIKHIKDGPDLAAD
jgi:hypothetical protein